MRVPGDKSLTHRALLLAALADGTSRLGGLLTAEDAQSTARVLRALGLTVPTILTGDVVRIDGRGLRGLEAPAGVLDCGNSGTTARLLLGILAAQPLEAALDGDASLRARPMRRVTAPLTRMGGCFVELGERDRLPLRVLGQALRGGEFEIPHASAQVKSAILLAGLCAGVRVRIREPARSRDHTERLLARLGATVRHAADGTIELEPVERLAPLEIDVPGDVSSAAFLVALAVLGGSADDMRIRHVGVNPTRTGMLDVLARMGAKVEIVDRADAGGEDVADLVCRQAQLRATEIRAAEVPALIDELPALAILAARADGETRVSGAAELRVKESDRITAIVANLRSLGVEAAELEDGFVVRGSDAPLAGRVQAGGDHRIAMAFGVLAALPGNDVSIDDRGVADISFPGFWDLLRRLSRVARR